MNSTLALISGLGLEALGLGLETPGLVNIPEHDSAIPNPSVCPSVRYILVLTIESKINAR